MLVDRCVGEENIYLCLSVRWSWMCVACDVWRANNRSIELFGLLNYCINDHNYNAILFFCGNEPGKGCYQEKPGSIVVLNK